MNIQRRYSMSEGTKRMADKSAAQVTDTFERMTHAAQGANDFMKGASSASVQIFQEYNAKVLEFALHNTNAAFAYAQKLATVRSPTEMVELMNSQAQEQFQTLSRQAQELMDTARKATSKMTDFRGM